MAMKCQLVRPLCLNIAVDMHAAAIQWPFIPLPKGWYFNIATTEWVVGDKQHGTVKQRGDGLIKLGHDCQYLRPHLPFPVPFPEVIFWAVFTALGSSKTVWASFKTKHGGNPTAVMFLGFGSCVAVINQADCGDLWYNPTILSVQVPTNVFAGMSLGDILGCLLMILIDVLLSKLLEKVLGKLTDRFTKWLAKTPLGKLLAKAKDKVSNKLASILMKAPGIRSLVQKAVAANQFRYVTKILLQYKNNPFRYQMAQNAVDRAESMLTKQFAKQLEKQVVDKVIGKGTGAVGDAIKSATGLPVDPIKAATKPADVITDLIKGENNANVERFASLVDGRPYTPTPPPAPAPAPTGSGSW